MAPRPRGITQRTTTVRRRSEIKQTRDLFRTGQHLIVKYARGQTSASLLSRATLKYARTRGVCSKVKHGENVAGDTGRRAGRPDTDVRKVFTATANENTRGSYRKQHLSCAPKSKIDTHERPSANLRPSKPLSSWGTRQNCLSLRGALIPNVPWLSAYFSRAQYHRPVPWLQHAPAA